MIKSSKVCAVVIAALMMVSAMFVFGCSNGNQQQQDPKQAFTGDWYIYSMSENGEETTNEDIATMKAFGLDVTLNLSDDGKMVLDLFGETIEGTWSTDSSTHGSMSVEGQSIDMSINDDKLVMEQEGSVLTFSRDNQAASADSMSSATKNTMLSEDSGSSSSSDGSEASAEASK